MVFCISFNGYVLYPFEVFCKHFQNSKFNASNLCQLYTFVSNIHSILLTVKLLSALWPLLHKIMNTVLKFLSYGKCL